MALKFEQPNFDPNQSKQNKARQDFLGAEAIPSLLMQYQQLKQQQEIANNDYAIKTQEQKNKLRELIALYGNGGAPPDIASLPSGQPGSTLPGGNGPLGLPQQPGMPQNTIPGPGETKQELMDRVGIKGVMALQEKPGPADAVLINTDKEGKQVGDPTVYPNSRLTVTKPEPTGSSGMTDVRKGNLEIRRDTQIDGVISKFKTDQRVKKAYQSLDSATDVKALIASGNPIAANAVPTYMARMSGEVGALAEGDKKPFGGSRAILERAKQAFEQMANGTLTVSNAKFLNELTDVIQKRGYEKIYSEAVNTSKQKKDLYGISEEEWLNKLYQGPPQGGSSSTSIPSVGGTFNGGKVLSVERID